MKWCFKFVIKKIKGISGDYLLLLHSKPDKRIDEKFIKDTGCIMFGGGMRVHPILYKKLIDGSNYFQDDAFAGDFQTIKEEIFDDIWHEYKVTDKIKSIRNKKESPAGRRSGA